MPGDPPLSSTVGYLIVIFLSLFFALGMNATTSLLKRYTGETQTSEQFNTANRSVKTGLVAAAVVSSWTWAATLLQSSGVAYRYGVSGPFWYAAGATVQILLFAVLAIELKRRAPNAHTFLEVIRARYGIYGHAVYMIFGLLTNILVTAMLLTGGSAVITALTGMPTAIACFLLPVGVVVYTTFGGIKATFLTDYVHTLVILVIVIVFSVTVYVSSPLVGSPGEMWNLLQGASASHPVQGNSEGSYLTMKSHQGAIFFVINIIGNFGTVFMDQGYFQKAIAADPVSALPGYILGGLSWFAIPWLISTTMGLACVALESNPKFPTSPNRMSVQQVNSGLVLPYAAVTLLGSGGAVATLLLVFMAVTSAMSAELIAVSSIFTYDIYRYLYFTSILMIICYINPKATGKELIMASHTAVVAFGVLMAGLSTALYYVNVTLRHLFTKTILMPQVLPAALTLLWKRQSLLAAVLSPPLGLLCALCTWLGVTKQKYGEISIETSGQKQVCLGPEVLTSSGPMIAGNAVALLSPIMFIAVLTLIKPDNYDFESMRRISLVDDVDKRDMMADATTGAALARASQIAKIISIALTLILIVIWPLPLYATGYVFSKGFFSAWIVVGNAWIIFSLFAVGLFPVWQGRNAIMTMIKSMYWEAIHRGETVK
ncbi:putative urea active transporter 1 [Neolecta irregularis DAH-3]|uniref:Putative urea active transporter 1 n=1 Tax=Neolecta irregularis (strain DAH-3) TaxID=1198029 RepID=A0A1U7LNY6_NEOID|nr:putative urea active transporter 1 [Neolecta irregularis DAH-3]|eukprot:OLL24303.1 putative urea active transporter 1 [Neolecta irregularis DAH-3]